MIVSERSQELKKGTISASLRFILPRRAVLITGRLWFYHSCGPGGPAFIRISLPLFAQNFTLWYDTGWEKTGREPMQMPSITSALGGSVTRRDSNESEL